MRQSLAVWLACCVVPGVALAAPGRTDWKVGKSPMAMVAVGSALVWTDSAGSTWTRPSTRRARPVQLTEQHTHPFVLQLAVAGDRVIGATDSGVMTIDPATGVVAELHGLRLPGNPEEIVADDRFAYITIFQRNEVMRVPLAGGPAQRMFEMSHGMLALHGSTLFAASYTTGAVVSIPTAGGKQTTLARGIKRPTALAADESYVYVYSEVDRTVTRIEIATGATKVIGRELINSDTLVVDGTWIYTRSWGAKDALVRIAKDGSSQQVLADNLAAPDAIAVDARAVYVTSRDQAKIIRLDKSALR